MEGGREGGRDASMGFFGPIKSRRDRAGIEKWRDGA
jgi:hypothetical protein